MSVSEQIKDKLFMAGTTLHRAVFEVSKGRVFGRAGRMPVVELITTGRKSGARRKTMLTAPIVDGDTVVLVASYGGDPRHPAWYLNLRDNPEVELVRDGRTQPMLARTATEEERAELWPRVTSTYKGYGGYQEKTERTIPLVLLDPR